MPDVLVRVMAPAHHWSGPDTASQVMCVNALLTTSPMRTPLFVLLLASALHLFAQTPPSCGWSAPPHPRMPRPLPEGARGSTLLIPTVVHMHYGGLYLPIGPVQIQQMIEDCNAYLRAQNPGIADIVPAFAPLVGDLNAELRLATRDEAGNCISGIQYHAYDPENEQPDIIGNMFNTRRYLNIHIGPWGISTGTFPQAVADPYVADDMITLAGPYTSLANTLAHEVGHWFGLYHTFGPSNNTGTCNDDLIADTPETAGSPLDCILDRSECTPGVIENVQNHMDYSICREMFTLGQVAHMQAVLNDPTLVRYGLWQPDNLASTGITDVPTTCTLTADMAYRLFIGCTGTTVQLRAISEGVPVDSVHWTFPGGAPATAADDHPYVLYTASGTYAVTVTVFANGDSISSTAQLAVEVPSADANGLATVETLPFTEGFENGFSLPTTHLVAVDHVEPGWQLYSDAGHASTHCLYVPPGDVTVADTSDLVIGNFDLSGLELPTVQFKVASTVQGLTGWSRIQLLFRDQCSNIFTGNIWMVRELIDYASDHGQNYVPTDDGQWVTLQASFPEWNLATGAEFIIRLIRPAYPASFQPEAVYLDDLYIGDLPIATHVGGPEVGTTLIVAPNPATDGITVVQNAPLVQVRILDAMGRILRQERVPAVQRMEIDVRELAAGTYTIVTVSADGRLSAARLLKR